VFQRPQQLMSRFAREMDVIFWEEPVDVGPRETPFLKVREAEDAHGVRVIVPHLPSGMPDKARDDTLARLLEAHVASLGRPSIAPTFARRELRSSIRRTRKTCRGPGWASTE